MRSEVL